MRGSAISFEVSIVMLVPCFPRVVLAGWLGMNVKEGRDTAAADLRVPG